MCHKVNSIPLIIASFTFELVIKLVPCKIYPLKKISSALAWIGVSIIANRKNVIYSGAENSFRVGVVPIKNERIKFNV